MVNCLFSFYIQTIIFELWYAKNSVVKTMIPYTNIACTYMLYICLFTIINYHDQNQENRKCSVLSLTTEKLQYEWFQDVLGILMQQRYSWLISFLD